MKKSVIFKISLTLIMSIVLIAIGTSVSAVSDDFTILKKTDEEYVIYLKNTTDKEFEFAYTNNELENDEELDYIKNAKDSLDGTKIAYVDSNLFEKYYKDKENTYLWTKNEEGYIAKSVKVDLSKESKNLVTEEMISFVKETNNRINVNTENKDVEEKIENGIKYTTTTGKIEIKDDSNLPYYYAIVDIKKAEEYGKLVSLIEKINNMEQESTVTKIDNSKEFYELYSKLLSEVDSKLWTKVENMQIAQPKESVTGDKYAVWIRQGEENNAVYDVQIMICQKDEDKQFVKEEQVIKETSLLPKTYDSVVLFVVLGIAIILFIVVLVLRNKKQKETK